MSTFARVATCLFLVMPSLAGAASASGEVAAMVCSGCHGQSDNQMPDLSRYSAAQIEAMMLAFRSDERSDERPVTLMNRLAKGYSEIEIRAISKALAKKR
ncbi:MAG: sulfide dehydrogenase cytochrome subunit [Candidatus Azotimanducaceae bacterium]|jgi:sulfide dehydrogenase cytochrome subunit